MDVGDLNLKAAVICTHKDILAIFFFYNKHFFEYPFNALYILFTLSLV